jgi:zinc/manganese transport system substrate-binding protein
MNIRFKPFLIISIFILIMTMVMACQAPRVTNGKKTVVVTYSILGSVVRELIGDQANVIVSMPNGLDPHEWEPSAKDIEIINKADLVIENGLGLEAGMEKPLQSTKNRGVKFFTASDHIVIRHVGPGEGIPTGDPDQVTGAADPHLWTDPLSLKAVVNALATTLMSNYNMDVSSNAQSLSDRLDALNNEIAGYVISIPDKERKLVTGHESMGYFAQRYGFKLVGVIIPSLSSQAEVSAADLAALKDIIQADNIKVIFTELGTPSAVSNAIGQETSVKVIEITTHSIPSDGSYFTFMRNLGQTITNALK